MSNKKRKSHPFITFIKCMFIIFIAVILAIYISVKAYLDDLAPIPQLKNYKRNIVTQVYSSDDHVIKTFQTFHYEQVSIKEIPDKLKDAVIATEDKNFYTHDGYDLFGIGRSIIVNIINKKTKQGASTITQQLARILFLSNEKTFVRKLKEIQIAARIEKSISKDEILEMYLNNVYLGSGAYGVGAASKTYFNKELSQLTLAEAALIAGLPQAPSEYSPYKNIKLAEKRRNKVLKRMYIMKRITKKEYHNALKEKIVLAKKQGVSRINVAPYFIDYMLRELEELGFDENEIMQGGYKITTTLNYDAQVAANEAIEKNMNAWGLKKQKQQAALFSFSPMTGAIIAYCGGRDYSKSQYDRVALAVRPPGSSFKPIVYAAAIKNGWKPTDKVEDTPVTIGDWSPRNYGNKYRGSMPLFKALAISSNVVAVKLIQEIGIPSVIDMAKSLGLTTPLTHDYTIALGSNGVKLIDMAVVYGNFANGGYKVKPYSIEKIETERGKVIYRAKRTKITKVIDENTAAIMTAMLKQVIKAGTGRNADIKKPMAGKTGTTNGNKDAWFIGYTPDLVTGVFVGNDDNTGIGLTGGTVPAKIWHDMMLVATKKYGNTEFDYPKVDLTYSFKEVPYGSEEQSEDGENVDYESDNQNSESNVIPSPKNEQIQDIKKEAASVKSDIHLFKTVPIQLAEPINSQKKSENKTKQDTNNLGIVIEN